MRIFTEKEDVLSGNVAVAKSSGNRSSFGSNYAYGDTVSVSLSSEETTTLWHTLSVERALEKLGSTPEGLIADDAARRFIEYGPNELQAARHISPWEILFQQFKNILIIILLAATTLSFFLGHGVEAIAITVIVLFAVMLGFIQEYRAERAVESLRRMAAPTATVIFQNCESEVPARELVPGDVILLVPGDKIPADVRLIEAVNLQVEEAALTGESVPAEKHTARLSDQELAVADRKNMAYAGTSVTYCRGRAVVVSTGMRPSSARLLRCYRRLKPVRPHRNKTWIRSVACQPALQLWWWPSSSRLDCCADNRSSRCLSLALRLRWPLSRRRCLQSSRFRSP